MPQKRSPKQAQPAPGAPQPARAADAPSSAEDSPRGLTRFLHHAVVAAGLFFLILVTWSNSFSGTFVMDSKALVEDPRVHQWSSANVSQILNQPYWSSAVNAGLYRPFTTFSYLFNYAILGEGEHPAGYHWINLLLHWVNAFLVYLLALVLIRRRWPAVFVAALWALHPLVTESVTYIAGRADLLAGFAVLSGLLMYIKSTESAGWKKVAWLLGVAVVTAVGVFSKENAVAILGVIVLFQIIWWNERGQWKNLAFGCAATGVPILWMLYWRSAAMAVAGPIVVLFTDNPLTSASFVQSRLTAVAIIARYLRLLVWPGKLSNDYSYNQIPLATGTLHDWAAWIVVLAVVAAVIAIFKKSPVAFFFAGFAFLTFVPTSNLLFVIGTPMAERFMYLPVIGFAACAVLATFWLAQRTSLPQAAPVILSLIVVVAAARTRERNLDWHDDVTLWTSAEAAAPNSFKVHYALAPVLEAAGTDHQNLDRAVQEADRSVAILDPLPDSLSSPLAYSTAGQLYLTKGDLVADRGANGQLTPTSESLSAYQRALTIFLRGVQIDRAVNASNQQQELERGIPASKLDTIGSPELYFGLSVTDLRLGKYQDAYDAASRARMLALRYVPAYEVMGEALVGVNRREDAAVELFEGLMVGGSGDPHLMPLLQQTYDRSLDTNGCAFMQTPQGASLNAGCPIVHKDVCEAAARLSQNAQNTSFSNLADQFRQRAVGRFGCSINELVPHSFSAPSAH
jgi:protein O-mannosyl-transferase